VTDPKKPSDTTPRVLPGVEGGHDGIPGDAESYARKVKRQASPKRKSLSIEDYVTGVLKGDRTILARTITLVESNAEHHQKEAASVLNALLDHTGNSIRIGLTGVPGAGKSTFIEEFGYRLCEQGHRVAVLAIDPSSSLSHGSILGDKTRMERLSRHENGFIRPSPSGGTLGGVARKTRESLLVCEAAGYDAVLVETVGVGQSEATVRSMVDFFLLLGITGAGDELQSIKKGVIELADLIVINKADGDNEVRAKHAAAEFNRVLHYLLPATKGWSTSSMSCSAVTGEGLNEIWNIIEDFHQKMQNTGVFQERRAEQLLHWLDSMLYEAVVKEFCENSEVSAKLPGLRQRVADKDLHVTQAVIELLKTFRQSSE
jgi:LAO/AO transport system kinase